MLKTPPYAKELNNLIRLNKKPDLYVNVYIGTFAWKFAQKNIEYEADRTIVLPAWDDPSLYFLPVKNCNVVLWNTSEAEQSYINDVIFCLFEFGANIVLLNQFQFAKPMRDYSVTIYKRKKQ